MTFKNTRAVVLSGFILCVIAHYYYNHRSYSIAGKKKAMVPSISRIRGCLLGALAGDCLGFPFENEAERFLTPNGFCKEDEYRKEVVHYVAGLSEGNSDGKMILYTDDTCMATDIAESLLECNGFKAENMAKRFTETYFANLDKPRSYGSSIGKVFYSLKKANYEIPFQYARQMFGGQGSCGNGGAMRVAPAVLYYANDFKKAIECVKNQCLLTHTHPDGIMGAILEASAIYEALHTEDNQMNVANFIGRLKTIVAEQSLIMKFNETGEANPYYQKLNIMEKLVTEKAPTSEIVKNLGTGVLALRSVPAAVYAFLRCLEPVDGIPINRPVERTIAYAISLGGDTDTIATMAGAIAGAYYGDNDIPAAWSEIFEGAKKYELFAEQFSKLLNLAE